VVTPSPSTGTGASRRHRGLTRRSSGRQHWPWLRHLHGQCWCPPLAALLPAPLTLGVRPSYPMAHTSRHFMPLKCIALLLILCGRTFSALAANPVACETAPHEAVTTLPKTVADLALILCSPSGHALLATDGYVWLAPNNKPFFLHAASPRGPVAGETQHSAFFTRSSARQLQDEPLQKAKGMYQIEFSEHPPEGLSVVQLDLLSNKGFRYNVFFYLLSGKLERIIGCINECSTSVGMKQVTLSRLRQGSGK
jgi:hypothetical protein